MELFLGSTDLCNVRIDFGDTAPRKANLNCRSYRSGWAGQNTTSGELHIERGPVRYYALLLALALRAKPSLPK